MLTAGGVVEACIDLELNAGHPSWRWERVLGTLRRRTSGGGSRTKTRWRFDLLLLPSRPALLLAFGVRRKICSHCAATLSYEQTDFDIKGSSTSSYSSAALSASFREIEAGSKYCLVNSFFSYRSQRRRKRKGHARGSLQRRRRGLQLGTRCSRTWRDASSTGCPKSPGCSSTTCT